MLKPYLNVTTWKSADVRREAPTGARVTVHYPEVGRSVELTTDEHGQYTVQTIPSPGRGGPFTVVSAGNVADSSVSPEMTPTMVIQLIGNSATNTTPTYGICIVVSVYGHMLAASTYHPASNIAEALGIGQIVLSVKQREYRDRLKQAEDMGCLMSPGSDIRESIARYINKSKGA